MVYLCSTSTSAKAQFEEAVGEVTVVYRSKPHRLLHELLGKPSLGQ